MTDSAIMNAVAAGYKGRQMVMTLSLGIATVSSVSMHLAVFINYVSWNRSVIAHTMPCIYMSQHHPIARPWQIIPRII